MFTVEMEADMAKIVSMDEQDSYEDVAVLICDDDTVFITQHSPDAETTETVYISYQQLNDIVTALQLPVGMYKVKPRKT